MFFQKLLRNVKINNCFAIEYQNAKQGFIEYAKSVLKSAIPQNGEITANINVFDIEKEKEAQMSIARLIMILAYGFVGMLILIGLTNVISTISANIRSRSREFAVLRSAGMTGSGLNPSFPVGRAKVS